MLPVPAGQQSAFVSLLVMTVVMLVSLFVSMKGIRRPSIRKIAGLEAVREAIGRATEMGRPIHFSPGIGELESEVAPQTLAGLSVLSYVAGLAAEYKATLWTTIRSSAVQPLATEVVRLACLKAGASGLFDRDKIMFLSDSQFAYASGVLGLMHREKVAANIMIGAFWAESLVFAEGGYTAGAIQVAGTAQTSQIPFFVAACDYCLIGEEIFAAGAYISGDPVQLGAIWGQDYAKLVAILLIAIGTILSLVGNGYLLSLFKGPLWPL